MNSQQIFDTISYKNYEDIKDYFEEYMNLSLQQANNGDSLAMNNIGYLYHISKDVVEAIEWYKKSASLGNSWGMYNIHMVYYDNDCDVKGKEWIIKSANAENLIAMYELYKYYDYKKYGIKAYLLGYDFNDDNDYMEIHIPKKFVDRKKIFIMLCSYYC